MDEMTRYIFSTLGRADTALRSISKNLVLQRKFNNRVAMFSVLVVAHMVVTNRIIVAQSEKIKKLSDEIEKLKEPTESCEESTESES